jgi:outer membrane protein
MNLRTLFLFTGGIVVGGLILFLVQFLFSSGDTTRYVSMTVVFQECRISAKYQEELKSIEQQSNAQLAEMENEIRHLKTTGTDAAKIATMEQELLAFRDQLSEEYSRKSEAFDKIIWDQINAKINAYGKEQGYDYIFGAKGDGSIMYASDKKDITKEVIAYINQ